MARDVTAIVACMTDAERPFIRDALRSIHHQTVPCDTIIAVEKSNKWIDEVLTEFPGTRVMRRPAAPLGVTRNAAIAAAQTEFVAFLDGDDVWMPRKTSKQLAFLHKHKADFVGGDHVLMTEEGRVFAYALARYLAMPSAWMVRRETMLRHPFREDIPHGIEDGFWWTDTWGRVQKNRMPEPLIKYRVRRQSLSNVTSSKRRKLALAKLSALPLATPLLLATTYVMNKYESRPGYIPHKSWLVPAMAR